MQRRLPLFVVILISFHSVYSQHATLGTGALTKEIWWFDWAGFTITEGASRTFNTNGGLVVTATFLHTSPREPVPFVMNTWSGSILHLLYDFSNPAIQPALFDNTTFIQGTCGFTMTVSATRSGIPVPFRFIAADAEASNQYELTTLKTSGTSWQTIEFLRNSSQNSDPLTGCGTQTVILSSTYGEAFQSGQNPILSTLSATADPLVIDVFLDHGNTSGGMALAFGIFESVDRGDLPASYGNAEHDLLYHVNNSCNYQAPFPSIDKIETLKIGTIAGDADPLQYSDDNTIGSDEDGVSVFPVYDGSGFYKIQLTLGNTTGSDAWLTGWFDFNRNGTFDNGESAKIIVPTNTTSATLIWTGLPGLLPKGTVNGYGFRFRISSDLLSTQRATGYAKDGEVEDYFVPSVALCYMKTSTRPDTTICSGLPIQLHASGGDHYSWSNTQDLSDPAIAAPIAIPSATTKYYVNVSNAQGCDAKDSVTITLRSKPVLIKTNDTTICSGKTVLLSAGGANNYSWTSSDGAISVSGPSIAPAPVIATKYYIDAEDANGCSARDSIKVFVHKPGKMYYKPVKPFICKNDSAMLEAWGGDSYAWSSYDNSLLGSDAVLTVKPLETQSYQVQITDNICQLTETLQVSVVVKDPPATTVSKSNDLDCTLGQAVLRANGGIRYLWDNNPDISSLTSADPIVKPLQTTTYYVSVTDNNGCSARDSITVLVDFQSALSKYPLPSAFTPNNDGRNDCFGLKYWGRITSLSMEVYNRQGIRVFYTRNPDQCWDGSYSGKPQPSGTYIYQIVASTACGTAYRKGTIILIR